MLKKLKLPALALGTALAIMSPGAALARDRDDRDHERREWREHERHERRERVWRERSPGFSFYYGRNYNPYSRGYYANGFYDQRGRWHPSYGYYDRWGRWHPY
jgi:hypothetical protein